MRAAEEEYREHLFSEVGIEMYLAALRECRSAVAALLGIGTPAGVSLLANSTTALQILLSAIGASLATGATILISDQEHPCVLNPLKMLAARGVEIVTIDASSAAELLSSIEEQVRRKPPACVILSQVSYKNGRILPVAEVGAILARQAIPYIVDGAQAFAHIPVDVPTMRASAYVFSGHKWIGGPWGTGGLWTSEEFAARNHFTLSHWTEEHDPPSGGRYEGGTINYALATGFAEACRQAHANGTRRLRVLTNIQSEIGRRLEGILPEADRSWGDRHAPGIISYLMPSRLNSWTVAARMLENHGVAVKPFRPPERPDAIRISYSPSTSLEEIRRLIEALRAEVEQLSKGVS
jgi:selenocysteine lyase/cysteine desulfurase